MIDDAKEIRAPSGTLTKIRVFFVDGSFLDIYWSASGRYSLHYERFEDQDLELKAKHSRYLEKFVELL